MLESYDMQLALGLLATLLIGIAGGWVACRVHRRLRLASTYQCPYCNGHGYFADGQERDRQLDSTLAESRKFRP